MKSQYRVSGLLLAGFFACAAGTPASALTEDGKNLLERLRGRIEAKEAAAARRPVETIAPPAEFKTQTPPARAFEPGVIVAEPATVEKQKADEKKNRKPAVSQSEKKARAPKQVKPASEKQKKASKPLPPPAAPPVAPVVSVATNAVETATTVVQTPPAAGSARSFGELSDAELIQYAHDHMWSKDKSRKHNPPWTPPSKPKKKKGDKQKADTAPAKSDSKKTGATQTKKPAAKGKS